MPWIDDNDLTPKAKRAVGRPVENPFHSTEIEEDFVRRGEAMLKLYYKDKGPKTRLNFVFDPDHDMSKTLFWSIIFVYYLSTKQVDNNLQGFLNTILLHFDPKVTSDRTSLCQSVGMLTRLYVNTKISFELNQDFEKSKEQKKYREKYQYVVKLWQGVL